MFRMLRGRKKIFYKVINNLHEKSIKSFDTLYRKEGTILTMQNWMIFQLDHGHLKNYRFEYAGYIVCYINKEDRIYKFYPV